jgi:polar amino acid transport system ATP-binding protein
VKVRGLPLKQAREKAMALLERVGLSEKAAQYPAALSGGQQQRVAIARTLAMEPRLILLDEVTSALDPELVGEVLDVVQSLAADGMTMMIVTHEMQFAREVSRRVAFMAAGEIVELAPPADLFGNPKNDRLRAFLGRYQAAHRI